MIYRTKAEHSFPDFEAAGAAARLSKGAPTRFQNASGKLTVFVRDHMDEFKNTWNLRFFIFKRSELNWAI
jgi:hypothetical protein